MTAKPLCIAIIDQGPARAAVLEAGLREAGLTDIHLVIERFQLLRQVAAIAPDVVLIDLESPNRDVLDAMFAVSRAVARPIAMFVDQSDASMMEAAIDAGVSAYVVDGLRKGRIKAVLDLSIARLNAFRRLKHELHAARSALADRKTIDRAKAIVMKQRGLDEAAAYALLRTAAMQQSQLFLGQGALPSRDWLAAQFAGVDVDAALLAGAPAGARIEGAQICACFNAGLATLTAAIRSQGLADVAAVGAALGAGRNCSSCKPELARVLRELHESVDA